MPQQAYQNAESGDDIRRDVNGPAKDFAFGCYTGEEIFSAPRLVELFTSDVVLDAVESFLGAWPMIFSVNAFSVFSTRRGVAIRSGVSS